SLSHLFVKKPRRIEPIPHQIANFKEQYENYFKLVVDIFFILNRYEARGRREATKPRLARDALRTVARHYYEFYGIDHPIRDRETWRKVLSELLQFLEDQKFEDICQNKKFVRDSIGFMSEYGASI